MSQKYHNINNSFPKQMEMSIDLFKAMIDQDLIVEVDLKKALTELEGQYWNPFDRVGSARRITSEIKKVIIVEPPFIRSTKYFYEKINNILEKAYGGKEGVQGETRIWGGKTYRKQGKDWIYVGQHSKHYEEFGLAKKNVKVDVKPESIGYVIKNVGPGGKETVGKHVAGTTSSQEPAYGTYGHEVAAQKRMEKYLNSEREGVKYKIGEELGNYKIEKIYPFGNPDGTLNHVAYQVYSKLEKRSKTITQEDLDRILKDYKPYIKSKPSVYGSKADLMQYPAYFKDMSGENVFELGGKRWQYVWADYNGKIDIGVYSLDEDIVYGYDWFQDKFINKPHETALKPLTSEFEVRDALGGELSGDYEKDLEKVQKQLKKTFSQSLYDEAYNNTMMP